MRVAGWNAKVNRNDDAVGDSLAQLIADLLPDVICLQESKGYIDVLRNRFDDGWHTYAHKDWEDSAHNPVMTRRDLYAKKARGEKDGWDTLRTQTPWVGPQGGKHNGRTWTWVRVSGIWIMSLHRCTDGDGKNTAEFGDEHAALVKWIGNHSPCIVLGDHNNGPKQDYAGSSKRVAKDSGTRCVYDESDPGVDYAITTEDATLTRCGNKYGSDHRATLLVVGDG